MVACGNTPPIKIKSKSGYPGRSTIISNLTAIADKGEYVGLERLRFARLFDVPMAEEMPPGFPAFSLSVKVMLQLLVILPNRFQTQRALCAITLLYPERLAETLDVLFHRSFAERKEIHTPESQLPILSKIFGETGAKGILAKASRKACGTLWERC